jgi:hypothetical protein
MRSVVVALSILLLAGCTDPAKAPAQAALQAADAALAGLDAEVERGAPDEARTARAARDAAQARASQGDWKGALAGASAVPAAVQGAVSAAAERRAALAEGWAQAVRDVPNLIFALEDRLDGLDEAKRLPAGLDRVAVAAARQELKAIQGEWELVSKQAESGEVAAGLAKAEDLRARARAVISKVGLR